MKTDIWMPLFINDYLGDTMELDAEGHGIYLLLLMAFWKKGFLPLDQKKLLRIAKTENTELLEEILDDFFQKTDAGYSQKRAEEEKERADRNRETARENGKKGGRPKKQKETHEKPMGYEENNPEETREEPSTEAEGNPEDTRSEPSTEGKSNQGKTQNKPSYKAKGNPEKSSSPPPPPSPLTSEEKTPLNPPSGETGGGGNFVDELIKHWNGFDNLPHCSFLSLNLPDVGRVRSRIDSVGKEETAKAIGYISQFWEQLEPRYRPSSFNRFITNSLDRWLDSARPWERYRQEQTAEEQAAFERSLEEVFG